MIIGTGVDIIEIDRISRVSKNDRFFTDCFSAEEIVLLESCKYSVSTVAGRFAAKEAVLKALGCGIFDLPLRDISVMRAPSGQPVVTLTGKAEQKAKEMGISKIHVSISHDLTKAIAMAVAEGETI